MFLPLQTKHGCFRPCTFVFPSISTVTDRNQNMVVIFGCFLCQLKRVYLWIWWKDIGVRGQRSLYLCHLECLWMDFQRPLYRLFETPFPPILAHYSMWTLAVSHRQCMESFPDVQQTWMLWGKYVLKTLLKYWRVVFQLLYLQSSYLPSLVLT